MEPIQVELIVGVEKSVSNVADFVKKTRDALESQLPRSVEKAKQSLDELTRKFLSVSQIVEKDKQRLDELTKKREQATGAAKKQADQEIENTKRIIAGREIEILKMKEKVARLDEIVKLAAATSEQEAAGIRKATQARITELGVMKDQIKSQAGITKEVKATDTEIGKYISRFATFGTAVMAINAVTSAVQAQKDMYLQTLAALDKLQDRNKSQQDKHKDFFNNWGINGDSQQVAARTTIANIAEQHQLTSGQVLSSATDAAAAMRAAGIPYDSPQGQGIIGNLGLGGYYGLDTKAAVQVLGINKGTTGASVNSRLGTIRGAFGGNASRANAAMRAYSEGQARFNALGLSFDQFLAADAKAASQYSEEETQSIIATTGQGLARHIGQSDAQLYQEWESAQEFDPQKKVALDAINSTPMSFAARMAKAKTLRKRGTSSGMDNWYSGAIANATAGMPNDESAFLSQLVGMNDVDALRQIRAFAGPKNATAMLAFLKAARQGGTFAGGTLPSITSPIDIADSRSDIIKARSSLTFPTDPSAYGVAKEATEAGATIVDDKMGPGQRGASRFWSGVGTFGMNETNVIGNEAYGLAQKNTMRIIELVKLRQQTSDPTKISRINSVIDSLWSSQSGTGGMTPTFRALMKGKSPYGPGGNQTLTDAQVLKDIQNQGEIEWIYGNLPAAGISSSITESLGRNSTKLAPVWEQYEQIMKANNQTLTPPPVPMPAPATQPTTKPSTPVSINNHYRVVNYGYGTDSIGGTADIPNYFG